MLLFLPIEQLPIWGRILVLTLYAAIAGMVTGHVLLKRSAVPAALGWIGVAWLSPVVGGLLYYVFGINRVTRRALKLSREGAGAARPGEPSTQPAVAANIAELAAIGQRVTGQPLSGGNAIAILHGGDEAYPAMLAAIDRAQHSVALATYIFRSDAIGRRFTDALIAAHGRGVAVCVLLDSIGSGYFRPRALRRLRSAGVPVARFLHTWMPWRMPFLNMRNHKKLLVVDGRIGFTGGLNVGAENSLRHPVGAAVDDVHMRIEGPVVRQLLETFAQDWSFTTDAALEGGAWWPALHDQGTVFARGIRSGPDADIYKLEAVLGAALSEARRRVRIVTPYFLPDERLLFAIAEARLRGVTVEILIPERTDYFFLDWAMRAHLRFFHMIGQDVYFSPAPFDHAKLMTVDGAWCLIGSSNWDTRSLRLNFEFDLECCDLGLTARVDALIDRKIARAARLDRAALLAAPRWRRLRDAAVRLLLPYL